MIIWSEFQWQKEVTSTDMDDENIFWIFTSQIFESYHSKFLVKALSPTVNLDSGFDKLLQRSNCRYFLTDVKCRITILPTSQQIRITKHS